ncbi:hypothetical protein Plhal703r1_c67g0169631 [Plasmopara halstedii]
MSNDFDPRSSRRCKNDNVWLHDSQNQNAMDSGDSSCTTGRQDEAIGARDVHPSSTESQRGVSSAASMHMMANETSSTSKSNQILPSLSSHSAALHDQQCSRSNSSSTLIPLVKLQEPSKQSGASNQNLLHPIRRQREEENTLIPDQNSTDNEYKQVEDKVLSASSVPESEKDVRIMFHGRKIYAHDLIGLRVAKTFPGYGRFLGQVVKFDTATSLYTVVYADGAAEDLTIDDTLEILIQDEIERADPTQPLPDISLFQRESEKESYPVTSYTNDLMVAPLCRGLIQVSDREAQFVISLFENHALPSLVRQGWRVQTNNSGLGDTCFVSSTGERFLSPLDVVAHIASNNELLQTCFPSNVHSAILSLLPHKDAVSSNTFAETQNIYKTSGNASRKRMAFDLPLSSTKPSDCKRTRQAQEGTFVGAELMHERMGRSSDYTSYRGGDRNSQKQVSYGSHFSDNMNISEACKQTHPELQGYRSVSKHGLNGLNLNNSASHQWSGVTLKPSSENITSYARSFEDSSGWCERNDVYVSDRQLETHFITHNQVEGRYMHHPSAREPVTVMNRRHLSGRFYQDSTNIGSSVQGSSDLAYPQYSTMQAKVGEFRRTSSVSRSLREIASFTSPSDSHGSNAAFSMVDVDRLSKSRSGSTDADLERGRSSRQTDSQQVYLQHQSMQQHRHTRRSHGSESHYNSDRGRDAQK